MPRKKTAAQLRKEAKNAKIMRSRGRLASQSRDPRPKSTPIEQLDLESYWNLQCGLKWIAEMLLAKKIFPATATELRLILSAAGENIKKRMQKHGKWIEKREDKLTHDISDKLAACLLKVQGSTPEQLKKMKGEVDKIVRGLKE